MAIYWHPYLAQLMRLSYEDKLNIEEEIPLGEMPLRLDILLSPGISVQELPFPFCCLGKQTIVEYKGPDDAGEHSDLLQLEIYALMYQQRKELWRRQEITLWLLASDFAEVISLPDGAHLENEYQVGKGVLGGILDGFPIYLLDLNEIPLNDDTLPLVLVSKGKRERELVEYMIKHYQRLGRYMPYLVWLHWEKLEEVLEMRELTLEEIGVDLDRVIRLLGGLEKVLQHADEEQAVTILVRKLGKEKVRQMIEQIPETFSADKVS
jgi:hypothetical protein